MNTLPTQSRPSRFKTRYRDHTPSYGYDPSDNDYTRGMSYPSVREVQGLFAGINYLDETEPQESEDELQEEDADGELHQTCYQSNTVSLSVSL